jgi:integrase
LQQILAEAKAVSERDWLMILVGFWHGLRASEVVALTPDNFDGIYLTVQRLKGSKKTTQPLVEHENPLLNERAGLIDYLIEFPQRCPDIQCRPETLLDALPALFGSRRHPETQAPPHILKHSIAMQTIHSARQGPG